jgi:hypothetical protein
MLKCIKTRLEDEQFRPQDFDIGRCIFYCFEEILEKQTALEDLSSKADKTDYRCTKAIASAAIRGNSMLTPCGLFA